MKPSQVKITGPLSDYFEVVDREYMLKGHDINVEIRRIKEGLPAPWHEGIEYGWPNGYEPQFTIEIRDDKGDVIYKDETDHILDGDELKAIMALGVDETASIKFDVREEGGETFKIGSTFKVNEGAGGRHYSPSTAQSGSSSDEGEYNDETSSDVPSIPSAGDFGREMRRAQQQVSSQMRQAQEDVRQQMQQAQEEVRQQMQQGMEDARKQMQQGMEDARRALGL